MSDDDNAVRNKKPGYVPEPIEYLARLDDMQLLRRKSRLSSDTWEMVAAMKRRLAAKQTEPEED